MISLHKCFKHLRLKAIQRTILAAPKHLLSLLYPTIGTRETYLLQVASRVNGQENGLLSLYEGKNSRDTVCRLPSVALYNTSCSKITRPSHHLQCFDSTSDASEKCLIFHRPFLRPSPFLSEISLNLPESNKDVTKTIRDPPNFPISFDCPVLRNIESHEPFLLPTLSDACTIVDDPVRRSQISKHAKNILKIRRRKMNRHKLKKLRKRMLFVYRKRKLKKLKLKEKIFVEKLTKIRRSGEEFDALSTVKNEIALAKKAGYRVDVFSNRQLESM